MEQVRRERNAGKSLHFFLGSGGPNITLENLL